MATKATKLPSGSWRVRVEFEDFTGKRRWKSFTAKTRKEAEFKAAQFAYTEKESHDPGNLTVGAAIDAYIDARTAVLSPATVRVYRQTRRCYFSALENIKLKHLRNVDIQRAMNDVAKTVSPKTVRNVFALLTATLREHHPDFEAKADLPQKVRHEIEIPGQADVQRLLIAAQDTPLENAILLAAGYGLRRGEVCALTYDDIDRKACTISVTKSLAKADDMSWVLKAPKSYAGTRTIRVSKGLIDRLFHNRHDKTLVVPMCPDKVTTSFTDLCGKCGIKCRFHDLRHYNASIMLALSVPDKYAMERLGQSTPGLIKAVYQHIMNDKREEVADTMNSAFDSMIG